MGAVLPLVELCQSADIDCKRYAVMALCNISSNSVTRVDVARGGGLQALIMVSKDEDVECRRYATIALCNLCLLYTSPSPRDRG